LRRFEYVLCKWQNSGYDKLDWEPVSALDPISFKIKFKRYRELRSMSANHMYTPLGVPVKRIAKNFSPLRNDVKFCGLTDPDQELELRDYQLEGVNWLLWNWATNRPGALLADEMGLGKTIQTVTLEELRLGRTFPAASSKFRSFKTRGPHLVIVPLSCLFQWQREFETWTRLNVIVYHGSSAARKTALNYEAFFREDQVHNGGTGRKVHHDERMKLEVLLTSYELTIRDSTELRKIPWRCIVVDEAHRLKNCNSKLNRELQNFPREYTILLTGTPIQNNTEELWALLNFVTSNRSAPQKLVLAKKKQQKALFRRRLAKDSENESESESEINSTGSDRDKEGSESDAYEEEGDEDFWFRDENQKRFLKKFGTVTKQKQIHKLQTILRPYLLRRVKENVGKQLPPKEEVIVEVELTRIQKVFYRGIYEKNTEFLYRGGKASNGPSLMNVMMELRKCCNHPFLNRGVEAEIIRRENETGSESDTQVNHEMDASTRRLIETSGKMVLLDKLLAKLFDGKHKVLIFSQMVKMLDLLEEYLSSRRYLFERIDGSRVGMKRQASIDRFNAKDSKHFVMLLSTRAGGLGLNLACADTVIIYDSDWNPQNDMQAQARSHRIGQTRPVKVYRLLTRKTYEQVMFQQASIKLGLDKAMLSSDTSSNSSKPVMTPKEIERMLKHGVYAVVGESEEVSEEASKNFLNASIDEILEKASRVVDSTKSTNSAQNSVLAAFSSATFKAQAQKKGEGVDVDLDDPEFWTKVAGFEKPSQEDDELARRLGLSQRVILDESKKRTRKSVVRMGMILEETQRDTSTAEDPEEAEDNAYLPEFDFDFGGDSDSDEDEDESETERVRVKHVVPKLKLSKKTVEPSSTQNSPYRVPDSPETTLQLIKQRASALKFHVSLGYINPERLTVSQQDHNNRGKRQKRITLATVRRVMEGLTTFGWGKWEVIRCYKDLEEYGDEQRIKCVACAVVKAMLEFLSSSRASEANPYVTNNVLELLKTSPRLREIYAEANAECSQRQHDWPEIMSVLCSQGFGAILIKSKTTMLFKRMHIFAVLQRNVYEARAIAIQHLTDVHKVSYDKYARYLCNAGIKFVVNLPRSRPLGIVLGLVSESGSQKSITPRWVVQKLDIMSKTFLCEGDELLSIDGKPCDEMSTLQDIFESIYDPAYMVMKIVDPLSGAPSFASHVTLTFRMRVLPLHGQRGDANQLSNGETRLKGVGDQTQCTSVTNTFSSAHVNTIQMQIGATQPELPMVGIVSLEGDDVPKQPWGSGEVLLPWLEKHWSPERSINILCTFLKRYVGSANADNICRKLAESYTASGIGPEPPGGAAPFSANLPSQSINERPIALASSFETWESIVASHTAFALHTLCEPSSPISNLRVSHLSGSRKWTRELDMHLLIGISRYGWDPRDLDYLATDPTLLFAQYFGVERTRALWNNFVTAKARADKSAAVALSQNSSTNPEITSSSLGGNSEGKRHLDSASLIPPAQKILPNPTLLARRVLKLFEALRVSSFPGQQDISTLERPSHALSTSGYRKTSPMNQEAQSNIIETTKPRTSPAASHVGSLQQQSDKAATQPLESHVVPRQGSPHQDQSRTNPTNPQLSRTNPAVPGRARTHVDQSRSNARIPRTSQTDAHRESHLPHSQPEVLGGKPQPKLAAVSTSQRGDTEEQVLGNDTVGLDMAYSHSLDSRSSNSPPGGQGLSGLPQESSSSKAKPPTSSVPGIQKSHPEIVDLTL